VKTESENRHPKGGFTTLGLLTRSHAYEGKEETASCKQRGRKGHVVQGGSAEESQLVRKGKNYEPKLPRVRKKEARVAAVGRKKKFQKEKLVTRGSVIWLKGGRTSQTLWGFPRIKKRVVPEEDRIEHHEKTYLSRKGIFLQDKKTGNGGRGASGKCALVEHGKNVPRWERKGGAANEEKEEGGEEKKLQKLDGGDVRLD